MFGMEYLGAPNFCYYIVLQTIHAFMVLFVAILDIQFLYSDSEDASISERAAFQFCICDNS